MFAWVIPHTNEHRIMIRDQWGSIVYGMAVLPAVCVFLMFIGRVLATPIVNKWDQNETQAGQQGAQVSFGGGHVTNCYLQGNGTHPMDEPIWPNLRQPDWVQIEDEESKFSFPVNRQVYSRQV